MKKSTIAIRSGAIGLLLLMTTSCASSTPESAIEHPFPRVRASYQQGDAQSALQRISAEIQDLTEDSPLWIQAQYLRAQLLLATGQIEAAEMAVSDLNSQTPDLALHELEGRLWMRKGEYGQAATIYAYAAKLQDPGRARRRNLDMVHLCKGLEAYAEGKATLAQTEWDRITDRDLLDQLMAGQESRPSSSIADSREE